jgi:hypothetical protein
MNMVVVETFAQQQQQQQQSAARLCVGFLQSGLAS